MSNLESDPPEMRCRPDAARSGDVEVLVPREVPLGGPRAMTVRRTLPQKQRSLIGAWCFVDHYGPDDVSMTGGMDVAPHPHTGLQTVSWLFAGQVEHRDSAGVHALIRPGELNLMTSGAGIAHSEVSTSETSALHGVQLWVALPASALGGPRDFQHHVPSAIPAGDASVRVFLGALAGSTSPVTTFTPLLGAEIVLPPGGSVPLEVDARFEHGVLVDTGSIIASGTELARAELGYLGPGRSEISLTNPGSGDARVLLLGGPPFGEDIVMWWNFVGRTHEDIVAAREEWEAGSERFGVVSGYVGRRSRLPAPGLPGGRLRPRAHPDR
ncbi:pirin family protein [Nakamurella panacisegetis]|uniref:pirin family protein n=1 Tax=Nakamurella panacisegetis TaxID=1090615 RepID=UPI000B86F66A|nr:pirin family protein [Nakamurella panacisegetis]